MFETDKMRSMSELRVADEILPSGAHQKMEMGMPVELTAPGVQNAEKRSQHLPIVLLKNSQINKDDLIIMKGISAEIQAIKDEFIQLKNGVRFCQKLE